MTLKQTRWSLVVALPLLLASCGGGSDGPSVVAAPPAPPTTAPPPANAAPQRSEAALAMFDAPVVHQFLAGQPIHYAVGSSAPVALTSGNCLHGGTVQVLLDGMSPSTATVLPGGTHTYQITYSDCVIDLLSGIVATGTAWVEYTSNGWNEVTARVAARDLRGTGSLGWQTDRSFSDVTANGQGVWRWKEDRAGYANTYTPNPGASLRSNLTTGVLAFDGTGSLSITFDAARGISEFRYSSLALSVNGTSYVLDGALSRLNGSPAYTTGEVRITRQGQLVARVYGDAAGTFRSEELVPLVPF